MKSIMRITAMVSVVAVGLAFASTTFAADKPDKPKPHVFTGVVDSCDAGCIKIKKGDDCKMFVVTEKTKVVTADKPEAAIADIKAGDKVTVTFVEDGDKLIAKKIGPPATPKKKVEEKK